MAEDLCRRVQHRNQAIRRDITPLCDTQSACAFLPIRPGVFRKALSASILQPRCGPSSEIAYTPYPKVRKPENNLIAVGTTVHPRFSSSRMMGSKKGTRGEFTRSIQILAQILLFSPGRPHRDLTCALLRFTCFRRTMGDHFSHNIF